MARGNSRYSLVTGAGYRWKLTYSYSYDAAQRRSTVTLPSGIVASYGYNTVSQLSSIQYQNGATAVGDLSYLYDAVGNRTSIGGSLARTNLPAEVSTRTHNAANQLTNNDGLALSYDANGNLFTSSTRTYTWDARNRLASFVGPANTVSFQYDVFGRRTQKTVNGTATGYQYDGLNLVRELSATTPTATYLKGLSIDETYSRTVQATGARSDFLTDALGSTVALTNSTGTVQTSYTYDPFGNTTQSGTASTNPIQYTGRENDGIGLYYYRARYYSPALGRFISSDPIGLNGGINTYTYVRNNPLKYIDPLGLIECTCQASNTGGVGYENGIKVCSFSCTSEAGDKFSFKSLGQKNSDGSVCQGADIKTRPNTGGAGFISYPASQQPFTVDSDGFGSVIDSIIYGSQFINDLNNALNNTKK